MHNGANHLVTVSTLYALTSHINVYDSMFCSMADHRSVQDQIMHHTITVHQTNVDKQMNGHDCVAYTIAFATSLSYGQDVTSIHRGYDRQKMWQHLVQYLEACISHAALLKKQVHDLWTIMKAAF